ncbi:MAG: oxidoreductase [Bacteroidota bacterium]
MKKALVIGASGLIGKELVKLLTSDQHYDSIDIIGRQLIGFSSSKIIEKKVDFAHLNETIESNTDIFCCVGSTINKAKNWDNFRKVDLEIPVKLAELCENTTNTKLLVISSIGANKNSRNKYLQMKGEMEIEISKRKIDAIIIFRPSILLGNRDERRLGESFAKFIIKLFSFLMIGPLKKYKGISAYKVANSLITAAKSNLKGTIILESSEI